MCDCTTCGDRRIFPYRVVRTIYERNSIPCDERLNGMLVTVVGADSSYKQFMLKGGDPCVNENWRPYDPIGSFTDRAGHFTLTLPLTIPLTDEYLNANFPTAVEGFRVTVPSLNTTYMKIAGEQWVMGNNIKT